MSPLAFEAASRQTCSERSSEGQIGRASLQEERLFGATLLIFANKQDVPSALPVEELEKVIPVAYPDSGSLPALNYSMDLSHLLLVTLLPHQILDFDGISKRHCRIVACSAVTGSGILDGFDW